MIGNAWDVTDPLKPVAIFDTNADIRIPIGLNGWLAGLGVAYGGHEVIAPLPLECMEEGSYGSDEAGTVLVRIRVKPGAVFTLPLKAPFTVRVHGADGSTQDDRTFCLKLVSR